MERSERDECVRFSNAPVSRYLSSSSSLHLLQVWNYLPSWKWPAQVDKQVNIEQLICIHPNPSKNLNTLWSTKNFVVFNERNWYLLALFIVFIIQNKKINKAKLLHCNIMCIYPDLLSTYKYLLYNMYIEVYSSFPFYYLQ